MKMFIILCFTLFSICKCEAKNENETYNDPYYNYDDEYYDPDEIQDYNCTYPNTNKTEDGFCECIDGYSGDPYNPKGCFKCPYNCTENADCEYPGVCKCYYGYVGDGLNKCELAIPELIGITPKFSYPDGLVMVNVTYKYAFGTPYQAYCRFGQSYVNHYSIDNNVITCMAPPRNPGKYDLSISFDERHWSKENFTFEYRDLPQANRISILSLLLVYLGILAVVSVILYLTIGKKSKYVPTKDEKEPFLIDPEKPKKRKKRAIKTRKGKL